MRRWLIGTCSFAAFFFAVTYPPSVQHADSRLATLVGFAVSLAAEEKSAKVQVGDLVLAIPAALGPAFAPERSGVATSFDYSKVAPALAGVRRVDSIYIKLHQLWPMQDRSTNEVVAIQANSRATSVDFYCRSKGRKGFESDAGAAARSDGEFVVFEDQSTVGTVYMSSSTRAFGAPLTARKGERGAFSWEGNGKTPIALFSFRIALTPDVNLVIRFTEKQLPRVQWPGFFEKLDATLRSWMSVPDPSTFKWYHEQMSACDPAR